LDPSSRPFIYRRPTEDGARVSHEARAQRYDGNSKVKSKWQALKKVLHRTIRHRLSWGERSEAGDLYRLKCAQNGCCHLFEKPGVVEPWVVQSAGDSPPD
jgi:hypothetical protein